MVIGDRVAVLQGDDAWTIESVRDRTSELARRSRRGRAPKVLAANLDTVFAVLSLAEPPADTGIIDRLLALIEASGIRPALVLNKLDLDGARTAAGSFQALYERVGYRTIAVSAVSGEGMERLQEVIRAGTSALIGPSGVGKSSLLNALDPSLSLRTGELSGRGGRGRHTTVGSRMIELTDGSLVADTPGFSDVALWGVDSEDVAGCFPEIAALSQGCRFRSCTHVREPECGVRGALAQSRIEESRYLSYVALLEEASEASG